MEKTPYISVIMPVYNPGQYLRGAIDAILRQTFRDFEFIIINDGSSDGSKELIDYYATIDPRIIAIHQKNRGIVQTANYAASIARGKYLARTDADDVSFDTKLEDLVATAKASPNAVVICGGIEVVTRREEYRFRDMPLPFSDDLKRALYIRNPIANGSTLVKKTAFEEVGGFDAVFAEDCHLWTKLFKVGDFCATGTTVYRWRMNPTGITFSNGDLSAQKEKEYLNTVWDYMLPAYLKRSAVMRRSKEYIFYDEQYGIEYKKAFLTDLCRVSIHLIKRGHLIQGTKQIIVVASTGRTGAKIVAQRFILLSRGALRALIRRFPIKKATDSTHRVSR